jgi:hypothetical protein
MSLSRNQWCAAAGSGLGRGRQEGCLLVRAWCRFGSHGCGSWHVPASLVRAALSSTGQLLTARKAAAAASSSRCAPGIAASSPSGTCCSSSNQCHHTAVVLDIIDYKLICTSLPHPPGQLLDAQQQVPGPRPQRLERGVCPEPGRGHPAIVQSVKHSVQV